MFVFSQSCSLFLRVVAAEIDDHFVDVVFQRGDFSLRFDRDRTGQVALGNSGGDLGDGANLIRKIRRKLVDVIGKIAPDSGRAGHAGLAAQFSFDADFARHRSDLIGECRERIDHSVDGVGQFRDFAFGFEDQLALQVAIGHRRNHFGNTSHLSGEVRGHEVHVVGQIFPGSGDALDFRLAAQLCRRCRLRARRA